MQTTTIDDYWLVLVRMRAVIALTAAAASAFAYLASHLIDPRYEAASQFYIVDAGDVGGVILTGTAGGLGEQPLGALLPSTTEALIASHIGIIQTDTIRKGVQARVPKRTAADLESSVDVWPVKKYLIAVRAWDKDPQVAADIANAYPAALDEFLRSTSAQRARDSLEALQQSKAELDMQLKAARSQREVFLDHQTIPSIREELAQLFSRKSDLEFRIQSAQARLHGVEQRIALAEEQLLREAGSTMSAPGVQSSAAVQRLMKEVSDLEADLAGARSEFDGSLGDRHPKIRALVATLRQKQQDLQIETANLQKSEVKPPGSFYEQMRREILNHYRDRTATKGEISENRVALARLNARIAQQQPRMSKESELVAEVTHLERMLESASVAVRNVRVQAALQSSRVVVLSEARAASAPRLPAPLFNAFVAGILGLVGGVYLAFACDWFIRMLDRTRGVRDNA